ncbi:DUF3748 domain-containing protein [Sphingobacterium sp. SGG-5]|uniref:DUF3748 domain-containing protein n=1 Tax=Sphingobacterium sp. SGG-5 TaxID=2710881 RepID=UPI0013EC5589|nr:DUF3748 domain-containing protein [Sphingobacterium sp. SGG-5]NGM61338.1 DUF3748 domain-containing protein [Sphingobacterium sp. SGG-5]
MNNQEKNTNTSEITMLTSSDMGHTIHHSNAFSKDDEWIVFDGRNDDTKIGETATIGVVNIETGEEKIIYQTQHQTIYGPGVGAVSFSPTADHVIFIHGLNNADSVKPYAMSRRVGVGIDLTSPMQAFHYDARDVLSPYVPGSLRGGTHSHGWSGDGQLISFTYNDEFVDPDLRTVGVMVPTSSPVVVEKHVANNDGEMYAAIVTDVVRDPKWGSDEISKAFDECWVGDKHTIAFQGHTKNEQGETITEIYVVDIDEEVVKADAVAVGGEGERPRVPQGIRQRRLSHTKKGLSDLRHWLRSSADGQYIYALAKDEHERNQIVQCNVQTGALDYISTFDFSVSSPINISYSKDKITFIANNNVYLFDIASREVRQLTSYEAGDLPLVGAPVFSRKDDRIAFNQFVHINNQENVQIKLIKL